MKETEIVRLYENESKFYLQECKHSTIVVASTKYPVHSVHIKNGLMWSNGILRCIFFCCVVICLSFIYLCCCVLFIYLYISTKWKQKKVEKL